MGFFRQGSVVGRQDKVRSAVVAFAKHFENKIEKNRMFLAWKKNS